MKTFTIGLNFFGGHDTSIFAIFEDDIYALSQERVSRIKHDSIFPIDAIKEMIRYKKIDTKKVKDIKIGVATLSFKEKKFNQYSYELSILLREILTENSPLYKKEFELKKQSLKSSKPLMIKNFFLKQKGISYLLKQIFGKEKTLYELVKLHLQKIFPNAVLEINFFEHHLCHAYTSYYTSGFQKALVFTFDGEGDGLFSKLYLVQDGVFSELGKSKNIFVENAKDYDFADSGYISIGNIYSIFTYLLGFIPNADEGKIEALAAFGNYDNILYEKLKNSYYIEDFTIMIKKSVANKLFSQEFLKEVFEKLTKEDISASVQRFTEDVVLEYLKAVKTKYGSLPLCISGGVMANVILNKKIYENIFHSVHITPAMGDDGISQGAGILKYLQNHHDITLDNMPYFGSSFTKDEIEKSIKKSGLSYKYLGSKAYKKAAKEIVDGKIGAIYQGRAEFGARALGNRSIIADVRDKNIQKKINHSIKNRPLFQPFCPSILEEERERLFEKAYSNKHMTIAFEMKDKYREKLPGAVHIDGTARVQFVEEKDNPNYYQLLKEVQKETGFGVIINTSFNKHGRTMVLTPKQAITDFLDTNLDFMVMEGFWINRDRFEEDL